MGNAASSGSAPRAAVAPQSKAAEPFRDHRPQSASTEQGVAEPSWESSLSDPIIFATLWLALATTALGVFTYRLWRATIRLATDAKSSGDAQAEKMERSVKEAARAAGAMEKVAESMVVNADQVVKSVKIMDANAKVQRTFGIKNIRAYIDVLIGGAMYQTDQAKFEADPLMKNTGNTPARNIQWRIAADILPVPLPEDFAFPLPEKPVGNNILGSLRDGSMSAVVPRRVPEEEVAAIKRGHPKALFVWGVVTYKDMFGEERRTEFAQQLYWVRAGDIREDGRVPEELRGFHLERHCKTT